jgi:hypothetical protein
VHPKYPLPLFLEGIVSQEIYKKWLHRKASAHYRRDVNNPNRFRKGISRELYKSLIHKAVISSGGVDFYTGESLDWHKISTYDNEQSKKYGSEYKAKLALLPSVDHIAAEDGGHDFVICSWRMNDAKNDLSLETFITLSRLVLEKHGSHHPAHSS